MDRKKYNKIVIITNGGNNGKEFIIEARKIIGSNAIAAISAIDVFKYYKNIQDMKNVLVLSGLEFHQKFFEAVIRNDVSLLEELKNEIFKNYFEGTNFKFREFDGEVFNYPKFKNEGRFSELNFNNNDYANDDIFNEELESNLGEAINNYLDDEQTPSINCSIV